MSTNLDWLTFKTVTPVTKVRSYVDLPTFTYSNTWLGSSEIITQFNFSSSKNFVLRNRPTKPTGVNFCLCIRWRSGNTVYRWKLWEGVGEVLNVPLYNGELIKKHFVLEVWSTNNATTSLSSTLRILTSVVSIPTNFYDLSNIALATGVEYNKASLTVSTSAVALPGSPKYRWESDYGVGLSGSDVETWTDKVSGEVLSYNASFFKPLYNASSAEIYGKPMIQHIAASPLQNLSLNFTPKTVLFLFRQRAYTVDRAILEISNGTDSFAKLRRDAASVNPGVRITGLNTEFPLDDTHFPVGTSAEYRHILWQQNDTDYSTGFSYIHGVDSSYKYAYNWATSTFFTCDRIIIANNTPGSALIDVAALIIWEDNLSIAERVQLLNYIKQTYNTGVPLADLPLVNANSAWLSND